MLMLFMQEIALTQSNKKVRWLGGGLQKAGGVGVLGGGDLKCWRHDRPAGNRGQIPRRATLGLLASLARTDFLSLQIRIRSRLEFRCEIPGDWVTAIRSQQPVTVTQGRAVGTARVAAWL